MSPEMIMMCFCTGWKNNNNETTTSILRLKDKKNNSRYSRPPPHLPPTASPPTPPPTLTHTHNRNQVESRPTSILGGRECSVCFCSYFSPAPTQPIPLLFSTVTLSCQRVSLKSLSGLQTGNDHTPATLHHNHARVCKYTHPQDTHTHLHTNKRKSLKPQNTHISTKHKKAKFCFFK